MFSDIDLNDADNGVSALVNVKNNDDYANNGDINSNNDNVGTDDSNYNSSNHSRGLDFTPKEDDEDDEEDNLFKNENGLIRDGEPPHIPPQYIVAFVLLVAGIAVFATLLIQIVIRKMAFSP